MPPPYHRLTATARRLVPFSTSATKPETSNVSPQGVAAAGAAWDELGGDEWRAALRKKLMSGAAAPCRGLTFVSGGGGSSSSSGSSGGKASASVDADDDDFLKADGSSASSACDVNELNSAFVRFNGLYSVLFSSDLHLLHALFRAMVASPNRHSVTLSLVRVIEHAGQMDAVVRAAAASEVSDLRFVAPRRAPTVHVTRVQVQSCSDAALLFRRRSLAFNLMKALLQVIQKRFAVLCFS